MSKWYELAVVLILKVTVSPGLALIEVANPWIVWSPAPVICQSLVGSPWAVFSHAVTLTTGGPQGPAAEAGVLVSRGTRTVATSATAARIATRCGRCPLASRRRVRLTGCSTIIARGPLRGGSRPE
jgi:hypothetical protein